MKRLIKREIKKCLICNNEFNSLVSENRKFCSQSCSATHSNKFRTNNRRHGNKCLNCGKLTNRKSNNFCSIKCGNEYKRKELFNKIENGDTTFSHRHYKIYLIYKFGEKCMKCGWHEINPFSNKIPIQLEHKDGNSENHNLNNLELLCPNCHSLTPTYMGLNMGNGRYKRRQRYKEGKSS